MEQRTDACDFERRLLAALIFASLVVAAAGETSGATTGTVEPPILEMLGTLEGVQALDVSADGGRAAAAFPSQGRDDRSTLTLAIAPGGEPEFLELPGTVRAMVFGADGSSLYLILHKDARRGPGESFLLRVDTETLKTSRGFTLPPTASSLDLWTERETLVVACANELRTFSLPAVSSGPLYRVLGDNRAVVIVPGGTRALVGQPDGLLLVDTADPQGSDGLPIRERFAMPAPVSALSVSTDGREAVARLSDDRTYVIDLGTWDVREGEPASYLVYLRPTPKLRQGPAPAPPTVERSTEPPPSEPPPVKTAEATPPATAPPRPKEEATKPEPPPPVEPPTSEPPPVKTAEATPPATAPPPPKEEATKSEPPPPVEPPTSEPPPAEATPPAPPAPPPKEEAKKLEPPPPPVEKEATPPPPAAPPRPPVEVPAREPPPSTKAEVEAPPSPTMTATTHAVAGKVSGPAASQVVAVVLLGPDSLVREAARVSPDSKGEWSVESLPPGRYRIVLDGGGQKVLLAEPPFRVIDVAPGAGIVVPEFRVIRAL